MEQLDRLPELWERIYGEGRGYLGLLSGIRPQPGAVLTVPHQAYFEFPGAVAAAVRWITREAGEARDLYACAHLLRRTRRRAEDAAPLRSLYVDLDAELPEQPLLQPTVVIESSPGRSHMFFRLTQPMAPERGAALNRRLAAALGGDPSGWDLSQVLRIPGTRNHKYVDRPLVRLVAEHTVQYDPRELDGFLPQLPAPPPRQPEAVAPVPLPQEQTATPPVPLTRPALAIWSGENVKRRPTGEVDRSASLVRIARILQQAGLAAEHIAAVLAERDASLGWNKYAARQDAGQQYRQIVDLVMKGTSTGRRP